MTGPVGRVAEHHSGPTGDRSATWSFPTTMTRFPLYAGVMHDLHRKAAEYHELAAQAHRTAAEHNEKGDNETGNWHSKRALEYSNQAFKLAQEAHGKSGKMECLSYEK